MSAYDVTPREASSIPDTGCWPRLGSSMAQSLLAGVPSCGGLWASYLSLFICSLLPIPSFPAMLPFSLCFWCVYFLPLSLLISPHPCPFFKQGSWKEPRLDSNWKWFWAPAPLHVPLECQDYKRVPLYTVQVCYFLNWFFVFTELQLLICHFCCDWYKGIIIERWSTEH